MYVYLYAWVLFKKKTCSSGTNLSLLVLPAVAGTTNDSPSQGLAASIYDVELNLWESLDFHEETQGQPGTFALDVALFTTLGSKKIFFSFYFFGIGETGTGSEDPSAQINSSTGAARIGPRGRAAARRVKRHQAATRVRQHGGKVAAALTLFAVLLTTWASAQPRGSSVSGVRSLIIMSS